MPEFSDLSISADQVWSLITKTKQLNAKDVVTEPDPGSNPTDDGATAILEDHKNDPTRSEMSGLIKSMNADEKLDLATLAMLGSQDSTIEEWGALRSETAEAIGNRITDELMEMPLLSDYLAEGLSKFGVASDAGIAD